MKPFVPFLEKVRKDINSAEVVSFDVFDTLLLRPYRIPTDLFMHIEKLKKMPYFCESRIYAEAEARRKNPKCEDITFDEIYDEIDDSFKPLKQVELDWEMMVLRANPEMKPVWDYAKSQGKKIVIASDMYLPTDFISKICKKNGFDNYDYIYVSGELGKTKASGMMYKHIITDLRVKSRDILHIGDNKKSDFENPTNLGIPAILYEQVVRQFLKHDKRAGRFSKNSVATFGQKTMLMLLAMRWQRKMLGIEPAEDYWGNIGYEYAGPVAYGYARWIESVANDRDLNNLLFVARDGYTLQKVFETFDSNIKHSYVYAPRFLNLICRLDYMRNNIKQSKAIVEYFSIKSQDIRELAEQEKLNDWKSYHDFIQKNKDLFIKYSSKQFDDYKNYLGKVVGNDMRVGTIDTITCEFSAQKLISHTLQLNTIGLYWGVIKTPTQISYRYYQYAPETDKGMSEASCFTKNWVFMEFLLTAPEYTIKQMTHNGCPVYDPNPSEFEKTRKEIYPSIAAGAVAFANDVKQIFGGHNIFLESPTVINWINCFCDNPNYIDMKNMARIAHAADSDHGHYLPIFSTQIPMKYVFSHPLKALKIVNNLYWKTLLQKIAVSLARPFRVETKGIRYLKLHLFPKLQQQYFILNITLSPRWRWCVIIGKEER